MKNNFNTISNNIQLFGHLFSDVHIRRKNSNTGEYKDIYVPIEYMGKERMYYLINNSQVDLNSPKIDSVYPKMGFELKDIFPDFSKMTNPNILISDNTADGIEVELNKIPVKFNFNLTIAVIHQTDLYHILEQIFTWFRPSITLKAKLNPLLGETNSDVNIVLKNGVFKDYNEEGPFGGNSEQPITYTLSFDQYSWIWTANDEDSSISTKAIREIEAGVFAQSTPLTEEQIKSDSSYTLHIPKHIEVNND